MKTVKRIARFDYDKCIGCTICSKVCPTDAIYFEDRRPKVRAEHCASCSCCVEHCPQYAIDMADLDVPRVIYCDSSKFDPKEIEEICVKAHFYPEQEICTCTRTKAKEVAAAILSGAKDPIDLSRMTGIRTGCKSCCAETPLRMLAAAGIEIGPAPGWQWYGLTQTLWTMDEKVREEFSSKYYFDDDLEFEQTCMEKGLERGQE